MGSWVANSLFATSGVQPAGSLSLVYVTGNSFNNSGDIAMVNGFVSELVKRLPNLRVTLVGHDLEKMRHGFPELLSSGHTIDFSGGKAITPHEGFKYFGHVVKSTLNKSPRKLTLDRALSIVRSGSKDAPENLRRFIDLIAQSDGVLFGGGGCLNDLFGLTEPALLTAAIAQAANVPVFCVGQSVGPFSKPASLDRLREFVDIVEFFELRESHGSMPWLQRAGADMSKVSEGADSAMLIETGPASSVPGDLRSVFGRVPSRFMTLNPRFLPESNRSVSLSDHIDRMTSIVQSLIDGLDLDVLSISSLYKSTAQGAEEKAHMDRPVAEAIRSRLKDPSRMAVLAEPLPIPSTKAIHAAAELSLSIAYHPCLFALSAGTPCFLAYTDEYLRVKNVGLANLWQVPELTFDIYDAASVEGLVERAKMVVSSKDSYRTILLSRAAELRGRVEDSVDLIASQLAERVSAAMPAASAM